MTSLWQVPAVVAVLLSWLASSPTSLVDAARHEAVRRQLFAKSTATYTNAGLPPVGPSQVADGPAPALAGPDAAIDPDDSPVVVPAASSSSAAAANPAPLSDEQSWHERMAALQATLESDQLLAEGMQSRVSSLQNDLAARDDPAQRAVLREQLARALGELDGIGTQIVADRGAIDKIREDARRQGVPPGWIR